MHRWFVVASIFDSSTHRIRDAPTDHHLHERSINNERNVFLSVKYAETAIAGHK